MIPEFFNKNLVSYYRYKKSIHGKKKGHINVLYFMLVTIECKIFFIFSYL